jgi:hypothetical protein
MCRPRAIFGLAISLAHRPIGVPGLSKEPRRGAPGVAAHLVKEDKVMQRWTGFLIAVAWCLTSVQSQAQDTYTLKCKKAAAGTVSQANYTDINADQIKISANGKVVEDKVSRTNTTWTFEEVVLERPNLSKKATLLKRTYTKALVTEDDKMRMMPYHEKTVFIEKKDGKYQFRVDGGGALALPDAMYLDQEFNRNPEDELDWDNVMLPRQAVKIGDSWKIDMAGVVQGLEKTGQMKLDAARATGTGKLLGISTRNNNQFGELEFKLEMPILSMKSKNGDIALKAGAQLVVEMRTLMCVDGGLRYNVGNMTVRITGSATLPDNPNVTLDFTITRLRQGGENELAKK